MRRAISGKGPTLERRRFFGEMAAGVLFWEPASFKIEVAVGLSNVASTHCIQSLAPFCSTQVEFESKI